MSNESTVAKVIELAIAAERAAQALYRGLATKFAHHQPVAAFWEDYAADEDWHARWLERLQETATPEQLRAPADPTILNMARRTLEFSVENTLKKLDNLQEAYLLANDVESSEINAIFKFLINDFSSDKETRSSLLSQLNDHVDKLVREFPVEYRNPGKRQEVKAQS